jgi:hypothetical protein
LASGSVRDTAVALDALRLGVGPVRGSANANAGRDSAPAPGTPSPSPPPPPASTAASSARRLFRAASASMWVPSTTSRRPPTKPASVHWRNTAVKSCSNTEESAKRLVCAWLNVE